MAEIMEALNTKEFVTLVFIIQMLLFVLFLGVYHWLFSRKISHQLEEIRAYLMGLHEKVQNIKRE